VTNEQCNQCGHRNPGGSNFCSSCGAVLARSGEDNRTTIKFLPGGSAGGTTEEEFSVPIDEVPEGLGLLVVKRGPNAGSWFVLRELTSAGRHPESDIILDDVTVSRRHVEFVRGPDGYLVRDVDSLNGTYVNRERVQEGRLRNGDEVQIGRYRLVFLAGLKEGQRSAL
jgi:pSer/pThr/pTyr-binding forkhead associated (FHA) protein